MIDRKYYILKYKEVKLLQLNFRFIIIRSSRISVRYIYYLRFHQIDFRNIYYFRKLQLKTNEHYIKIEYNGEKILLPKI